MSQVLTDNRGHGAFQRCGADANPGLKMAGAGLEQDTRLMAIGQHSWQDIGRVIQVEENIAGVARLGEGEKIDVIALKVACAQEAQYRSLQQLTNIPHSFAWARPSSGAMDQANEIKLIRHGRELAADCVRRKKESAIKHRPENAAKLPRAYNHFSANGNNPLSFVSQCKGSLQMQASPSEGRRENFFLTSSFTG